LVELGRGLGDGHLGGAVEHDAHRPVRAVDADQHDRALEVRITQRRRGEQQLAGQRFVHCR
jgi:hypothetical protein